MRNMELILVVAVTIALLLRLVRGRWVGGRLLGGVVALAITIHLVVEGVRLPMAPAYLAALASIAGLFRDTLARPVRSRWRLVATWIGGLLTLALVALPPWLFPIFRLPTPAGPHPIGGTTFSLADESRREIFGPDSGSARHLLIRVWYPAVAGTGGRMMAYADPRELASPINPLIPPALARQYRYVTTHTRFDAELAAGPFPVLVFSHGYTGYVAQNTPQMEALASHGYVVFSIGHSFDASAVVHPDGRVTTLDPNLVKAMGDMASNPDSVLEAMTRRMDAITNAATPEARRAAFLSFTQSNPPRIVRSVPVWAADTRHLLDQFRRPDGPGGMGRFVGKLDTTRIGVFGMSFGGSNAGVVCLADTRCKAGINIDGQQFGEVIDDTLATPFMIIASDAAFPIHRPIYDRLVGPAYLLKLAGTQHIGLTDLPLLAPVLFRALGVTGSMPAERSEQIMTDYVTAFFDTHLKGVPSPLLAAPGSADLLIETKNR